MKFELLNSDCVEAMRKMPKASIDSIVTDPPYELGFMGKRWDASGIAYSVEMWKEVLRVLKPGGHLLAFGGTRTYHRLACAIEDAGFEIRDSIDWIYGSGFPKSLDIGKAIDEALYIGKAIDEVEGERLSWLGPWIKKERERIGMSQHKLAELGVFHGKVNHGGSVANWELGYSVPTVEQFEKICEVLNLPHEYTARYSYLHRNDKEYSYLHRNDKKGGGREVLGQQKVNQGVAFTSEGPNKIDITAPATDAAKKWDGWGTALKPSHEPIVVARKPLIGTVAQNVLKHGVGGINIDGCRVEGGPKTEGGCKGKSRLHGGGITNRASVDQTTGRWPSNVVLTHHQDCKPIGTRRVRGDNRGDCQGKRPGGFGDVGAESGEAEPNAPVYGDEVVEAWVCVEGCPVAELDRQSGNRPAGARLTGNEPRSDGMSGPIYGHGKGARSFESYADAGGASRFFPCFRYEAKASRSEREAGCEKLERKTPGECTDRQDDTAGLKSPRAGAGRTGGARNYHPTVKPIALMRWLVRLVTPPEGIVLDPFMGSGTTGIACHKEKFGFIGIEKEEKYFKIAEARIAAARAQLRMF